MTETDQDKIRALEQKVSDLQIQSLQKAVDDHERRLRVVEELSTRFNFLLYLTVGGGLLALADLLNNLAVFKK
jgi:hypothetical protein